MRLVYKWLSLIFVKLHLKDKHHRWEVDRRVESKQISDIYDWTNLHHIHCVARSHYTKAIIDDFVFGTMLVVPIIENPGENNFDLIDSHAGRVLAVKVGDYAIVALLDDAGFYRSVYEDDILKIKGNSLSAAQLRELVARMSAVNFNINNRPTFYSGINPIGKYLIGTKFNGVARLRDKKDCVVTPGPFMREYIKNRPDFHVSKEELDLFEKNKLSFLFDQDSNFIKHTLG